MKRFDKYIFLVVFACSILWQPFSFAQSYTDYKPKYKEWNRNYIIDKIDYTDTRMIIHFRYVARASELDMMFGVWSHYVTIFGKEHQERWCLENVDNSDETFYIIDVKNIRRNDKLANASIAGYDKLDYKDIKPNEIITCEIHFKRPPNKVKTAHLLEGKYMKYDSNHFHAFNIKLKTKEEDLGSFEDMVRRIHTFERKMIGRPQSTFVIPNNKQNLQNNTVQNKTPAKPKAPLLQPPQKPAYPQESQVRM